jgi:type II secretion system protein D
MSVSRSLLLLLAAWSSAFAQEPPQPGTVPPPPGVPVPGANPQPAAGAPGANPAAAAAPGKVVPLGETKITEPIEEEKISGFSLANLYQKYTGRRVIVTTAANAAEFSFFQNASPANPLTYAEAAELLRKAAVLENFVFVEHPQDPNLDILTLATGGPRPTNVDVSVYNENTPLPSTDHVITYVMTLDHIKPDQALNIFTQVIGQFGAYGSIAAVPNASAVVITEKASLIQSLVDLKKTIDVPGSIQSSKFIKVQYADVTEIADTLTNLLTAQQSAQQTSGVQRTSNIPQPQGGAAPAMPQAGGGGASGGGEDTPVQILPDPRTNRIFAMGRPVDILFVEGLVREFDVPTDEKTFLRRKLRFLTVSEFLPIAGDAITRAFSGTGDGGGGATSSGGGASSGGTSSNRSSQSSSSRQSSGFGRSGSSGFGGSSSGFGGSSSGFGGGSSGFGGSGGGMGGGGSALDAPNVNSAPESMLVGRTLLVADNITNSIVAQGPPSALEIVERLLDQIDVKPDQVMISTVIGQLSLENNKDYGVGYLFNNSDVRAGGGGGIIPIRPIGENAASRFPAIDPSGLAGAGLRAYGTIEDLSIFVKALQTRGDFKVLSRPSIFTSNNKKGSISSGERIAIPTNSNSFTNGGASTNIEYQDVVLKLEVIPLVNSDNEITMEIALLNDEQNGTQTISGAGAEGQDLTVPRISTREIITSATVPNNDTIVLGGLIVNRNGKEKSGIPILSDIPYLGSLFGNTVDTNERAELLVFMQPSIVKNATSLSGVQQDFDNRYKVSPDARNFADGDSGVLPGVNDIQRGDKGTAPATPAYSGNSTVKPTIRPIHRR